jgi:hypothetical protein
LNLQKKPQGKKLTMVEVMVERSLGELFILGDIPRTIPELASLLLRFVPLAIPPRPDNVEVYSALTQPLHCGMASA